MPSNPLPGSLPGTSSAWRDNSTPADDRWTTSRSRSSTTNSDPSVVSQDDALEVVARVAERREHGPVESQSIDLIGGVADRVEAGLVGSEAEPGRLLDGDVVAADLVQTVGRLGRRLFVAAGSHDEQEQQTDQVQGAFHVAASSCWFAPGVGVT